MKLRLFLLFVGIGFTMESNAQDRSVKQQLFASIGALDFSYIENFFGSNGSVSGLPGVGMLEYRLSQNRIGAGVSVFSRSLDQEKWNETRAHRFLGIIPHFDFYWVNTGNYQVSSQLAVGYRFGETTITDNANGYFVSLYRRGAFQIIPLSVTAGRGRWLGRFEVGIGHKGFASLGIGLQL